MADEGGISKSGIQVSIPELNDGAWIKIPTEFSGESSKGYVNTFIDYYSRTGGNMDDMSRQLTRDYQNARDWYASGKTYSDFTDYYGRISKRKTLPYQGAAYHG